jgi:hypothetical protein
MTDEEIQKIVDDLGPLIQRVAKHEGLRSPEDIQAYLERLLLQAGLQCVDGVWREVYQ